MGIISNTSDPSRSRRYLCFDLFTTPFEWFVDRDENRASDGRNLRYDFLDDMGYQSNLEWLSMDASIFEMLVALANSASFQTDTPSRRWFWTFLRNVGLGDLTDDIYDDNARDHFTYIIETVMHRRYDPSGLGGFFPLRNPERDQRDVELWYQLSAYLIENFKF